MDYADSPQYYASQPRSHYEYVVPDYAGQSQLKTQVFKIMDTLEGWTPKEKASVMMDLVFNHRPEVIVEIGVWGGKSLIPVALAAKFVKKGIVYGIDPWSSVASAKGMDGVNRDWWSKVDHNYVFKGFKAKLKEYGLENIVRVVVATSETAPSIEGIGLLHIDGNHSEESSLHDVKKWVPLVKEGGIIVFDDVTWGTTDKAVQWLDEHCQRVTTFHDASVWGIWVKTSS